MLTRDQRLELYHEWVDAIGKPEFPNCSAVFKTVHPKTKECRWCAIGLLLELTARKYPHLLRFVDYRVYTKRDNVLGEDDGSYHQVPILTNDILGCNEVTDIEVVKELFPEIITKFSDGTYYQLVSLNDGPSQDTDDDGEPRMTYPDWLNAHEIKHLITTTIIPECNASVS